MPGSQTVAHANLITGAKIPEEKTRILRNVISDKLSEEGKTVAIGACVYIRIVHLEWIVCAKAW